MDNYLTTKKIDCILCKVFSDWFGESIDLDDYQNLEELQIDFHSLLDILTVLEETFAVYLDEDDFCLNADYHLDYDEEETELFIVNNFKDFIYSSILGEDEE